MTAVWCILSSLATAVVVSLLWRDHVNGVAKINRETNDHWRSANARAMAAEAELWSYHEADRLNAKRKRASKRR